MEPSGHDGGNRWQASTTGPSALRQLARRLGDAFLEVLVYET